MCWRWAEQLLHPAAVQMQSRQRSPYLTLMRAYLESPCRTAVARLGSLSGLRVWPNSVRWSVRQLAQFSV